MLTETLIKEPIGSSLGCGPLPGPRVQGIARSPWLLPTRSAGTPCGWCCQCEDDLVVESWDHIAAPYILLEPEWNFWRSLPHAVARKKWMRGRVAAKDAVRLLLLDRFNVVAPLETISVLPNGLGQPLVYCKAMPQASPRAAVSISHCGNSSVALAAELSEDCRGVGIDVASLSDDHEGLEEGGFAPYEMKYLDAYSEAERAEWLLRLWCAKEAAGKALGVGLMGNPLNYIVSRIDPDREEVGVELNFAVTRATALPSRTLITARVGCDRGMAFAVARLELHS